MSKKFYHDTDFDGNKVVAQAGKIPLEVVRNPADIDDAIIGRMLIRTPGGVRSPNLILTSTPRSPSNAPGGSASMTGSDNLVFGEGLWRVSTGSRNTVIGKALESLTSGNDNVVVGNGNFGTSTQDGNVGIGGQLSFGGNTEKGVAVGFSAEISGDTGCIAIGNDATSSATNAIAIGEGAAASDANVVALGAGAGSSRFGRPDGKPTRLWIGNSGFGTAGQVLTVNAAGTGVEWAAAGGVAVTHSITRNDVPDATFAPTGSPNTVFTWPAGTVHNVGDVFINVPDAISWHYDGTDWIRIRPPKFHFALTQADARVLQTAPAAGVEPVAIPGDMIVVTNPFSIYEVI